MGALLILLNILKIIGIILLIILVLIIVLLCVVLFVPFVYRIEGEKYQQISGMGLIQWLFGIICVEVVYADGQWGSRFKIFGRSLEKIKKHRIREKTAKQKARKKVRRMKVRGKPQPVAAANKRDKVETSLAIDEIEIDPKAKQVVEPEIVAMGRLSDEEPIVRRVKIKKLEQKHEKEESSETHAEESFSEKSPKKEKTDQEKNIEKEKMNFEYFKKMPWEEKKEVMEACTTLIKRVFREIFPQEVYINITAGTGDPASTGHVLAMAAIAKGTINSNINVKGKFDEPFFEGEFRLPGRIRIVKLIWVFGKFIFTKCIYKIWRTYMKGRGE